MIKKIVKKITQICVALAIMVTPVISTAGLTNNAKVYARTHTSDSSYTVLESGTDLYDSTNSQIDTDVLQALFNIITGESGSTYADVKSAIEDNANTDHAFKASELKSNNSNKDVNIMFGGLEWTVTYVSQSTDGTNHDDIIATLWMADYTTAINSMWSYDWNDDNPTDAYPSNLYGASYIRAELNGGQYATSGSALNGTAIDGTSNNAVFNAFAPVRALSSYIVTPSQVSWQEKGQKTSNWSDWDLDCPNENWGTLTTNYESFDNETYHITASDGTNTYTFYANTSGSKDNYNYGSGSEHTNNAIWKNDLLWLPSLYEVGYADSGDSGVGLWATSQTQRKYGSGENEWEANHTYYSWLRSGSW